jgi:hypothetical protein
VGGGGRAGVCGWVGGCVRACVRVVRACRKPHIVCRVAYVRIEKIIRVYAATNDIHFVPAQLSIAFQ